MQRQFERHDAEKLGATAGLIQRWMSKQGLTRFDLLIAARMLSQNKWDFEELVEAAVLRHGEYEAYWDDGRREQTAEERKIERLEADIARLRQSAGAA